VRILVTGGTGYLGRAIVRAVSDRGHTPVVFARSATEAGLPGEAIDGDVRDRTAVVDAARGCDAICHSAALVSIWRPDPAEFDAVNVGGLRHALDAAAAHRIERMVYTSSFLALPPGGAVEPVTLNDYQRTKVEAAELARRAREAGAPVVTLYPGVIYGPGRATEANLVGRLLRDYRRGTLPGLVEPTRLWSFAWIDDVAAAHVAALEQARPGREYALAGDNQPVMRAFEIARDLGVATRLPFRLPTPLARLAGHVNEVLVQLTGGLPAVTRAAVDIFRHDWPLDGAAAIRDLSLHITPLETGIAALVSAGRDDEAGTHGQRST